MSLPDGMEWKTWTDSLSPLWHCQVTAKDTHEYWVIPDGRFLIKGTIRLQERLLDHAELIIRAIEAPETLEVKE